jgi:hypothetical protein
MSWSLNSCTTPIMCGWKFVFLWKNFLMLQSVILRGRKCFLAECLGLSVLCQLHCMHTFPVFFVCVEALVLKFSAHNYMRLWQGTFLWSPILKLFLNIHSTLTKNHHFKKSFSYKLTFQLSIYCNSKLANYMVHTIKSCVVTNKTHFHQILRGYQQNTF